MSTSNRQFGVTSPSLYLIEGGVEEPDLVDPDLVLFLKKKKQRRSLSMAIRIQLFIHKDFVKRRKPSKSEKVNIKLSIPRYYILNIGKRIRIIRTK